jgi:hypothetical protein
MGMDRTHDEGAVSNGSRSKNGEKRGMRGGADSRGVDAAGRRGAKVREWLKRRPWGQEWGKI